jgi:hypothetical protein
MGVKFDLPRWEKNTANDVLDKGPEEDIWA